MNPSTNILGHVDSDSHTGLEDRNTIRWMYKPCTSPSPHGPVQKPRCGAGNLTSQEAYRGLGSRWQVDKV